MVEIARTDSGRLDDGAFLQALSTDLGDWPVGSEDRCSTLFEDVFGVTNPAKVKDLYFDKEQGQHDGGQAENHVDAEADEEGALSSTKDGKETVAVTPSASKLLSPSGGGNEKKSPGFFEHLRSFVCAFVSRVCCFLPGQSLGPSLGPFHNERFNIDLVLDSHASLAVVVAIWIFYITSCVLCCVLC